MTSTTKNNNNNDHNDNNDLINIIEDKTNATYEVKVIAIMMMKGKSNNRPCFRQWNPKQHYHKTKTITTL